MFHKELNLVQDKFLVENCWESNWGFNTEARLVLMNNQILFYKVAPLELLGLVTLIVQVLERVIHWLIQKELGL